MPLEDFVSPIIQAYLQGQQLKRQKERDILAKQEAEDESKIRQAQAQKLAKEIAHFDKNAELEDQIKKSSIAIAHNNLKHQFLTDVAEGRRKIPQVVIEAAREAAMQGDWNDELATPGIQGILDRTPRYGVPETFDIGGGVTMNRGEIVSPEEMRANKVANEQALNVPKIAFTQAANDIATVGQIKVFGERNKFDVANREDEQAFKTSERTGTQTWQEQMQEKRLNAQSSLAALERALKFNIVNIQQAGAKERTQMGIDAKNLFDSEEVDSTVESNIKTPLLTREGITKMGKAAENAITRKAAEKRYKIFKDADYKTLSELNQFNTIIDSMEKLSKEIGNGANVTKYTGDFTELGKQVKQLETYKPYLAKMTSVKGTQSDQDTRIAGGNLLELGGLGVAKTNRDRINAMRRIKAGTFMSFFPPGTNPEQIIEAANTFGITADDLKLLDEDQKRRKLNGGGN